MEEKIKINFNNLINSLPSLEIKEEYIKERKIYLKEFIKKGFPNKRIEDWKFSDLNQIISSNIKELKFLNYELTNTEYDQKNFIKNFEHNKIIFINGLISKIDFSYEEKSKIEVVDNLAEENTKKISQLSVGPSEFTNNEENSLRYIFLSLMYSSLISNEGKLLIKLLKFIFIFSSI